MNRGHGAVHELHDQREIVVGIGGGARFGSDQPALFDKRGRAAGHRLHLAEPPAHSIDVVRSGVSKHAAGFGFVHQPAIASTAGIVQRRFVDDHRSAVRRADESLVNEFLGALPDENVAVFVVHHRNGSGPFGHPHEVAGFGVTACHGTFEQDRFAGLDRRNGNLVMQRRRRGHHHRVHIRMIDQIPVIDRHVRDEVLCGDQVSVFRSLRANRHHVCFREMLQRRDMHIGAESESDHADPHR